MESGEEKEALLAAVPLFQSLAPDALRQVAELAVPRSYEAGEVVFREGDRGDTCFVVRSGCVRVARTVAGRTITLAQLRRGDMFGELAMFDGEERSATVEALEPTTAVALLAGDVQRLLLRHPEMAVQMLVGIADRLRAANEQIARQTFQSVPGRVATALLSQLDAQPDASPTAPSVIEATQTEIAQLAGSSRESVSRFLAELERAGVVTTGRAKVTVHDPAALRNYIF